MEALISKITGTTGLDAARAEKAVGILLSLVVTQGNKEKVAELLDKIPGAAKLVKDHGGDGAGGGGLMGILAGGMMGGPLAMITKLQAIGLSTDQTKAVAALTLAHAREKAGPALLREAASNIPGLSAYL